MVATVAALAVLTYVIPGGQVSSETPVSSRSNSYSAKGNARPEFTARRTIIRWQLLGTIYGGEEETK